MKTEKKRLKPLLPNELTKEHFEKFDKGYWIDRFFPEEECGDEARDVFWNELGGTIEDWESAHSRLGPEGLCNLWHKLVTTEVGQCTSAK